MQTFLPYPNFNSSAQVLDYRRLGKQRVEAHQILNALRGYSKGWVNHPAVKMWKHHEECLGAYKNAMIKEWIKRGYKNTLELEKVGENIPPPPWLYDDRFHSSHRAALLAKDTEYYSQFNWIEEPKIEYFWPV